MSTCTHGAGTAIMTGRCVLCGEAAGTGPKGQRTRDEQIAAAYAAGRASEGGEVEARPPGARPPWLKTDGKLRKVMRNPPPYRRAPKLAAALTVAVEASIDPAEHARLLEARICTLSLAEFVKAAWQVTDPTTPLDWNWHHQLLCDLLQRMFLEWLDAVRGGRKTLTVQNVVINIPPGTAKSRITSVFFPVWAWLHAPAWRPLGVSLNPKVADRDAEASRNLIMSEWFQDTFQPPWQLDPSVNARNHYKNTMGGGRQSFGMGATIVGLRFDALILDDPNDMQEIHSEAHRTDVNERQWDLAIGNRLNDLRIGLRIIVQQRGHESDLSGHVLRKGGVVHVRLPLEFEVKHDCPCPTCVAGELPFGLRDPRTVDGEVLHAARFTDEVIASEKARLGSFGAAGQLQQRPVPSGGAILQRQWFNLVEPDQMPTSFDDVLITADLANKKTTFGSFNVLQVTARKGSNRYILDVRRNRGEWTAMTIATTLQDLSREWSKRLNRTVKVLVEDKAMGPTVIDMLIQDLKVPGVIQDDNAQQARDDKVSRLMAVQPFVEGRNVFIPKYTSWADTFLHEVCTFPMSANDDQVDTLSMALNYWRMSRAAASFLAACGD